MSATLLDGFPPLQTAIAQAESWTRYLSARQAQAGTRRSDDGAAAVEAMVWMGAKLGELLPLTWHLTFDNLLRPGEESWTTVKELELVRQEVARLFFTAREAMDSTRQVAEALQRLTGKRPEAMDRLLQAIESARQLEKAVFQDWPSFAERPSLTPSDSLGVTESLAEALGINVEQAQEKIGLRRRERNAGRE